MGRRRSLSRGLSRGRGIRRERGSAGEKDIREGKERQRSLTGLSLTDSRLLLYTRQDPELALLPAPRCCCPAALPARRLLFFSQRTPAGRARVDSRRWCAERGNCGWNETDIRREARVVAYLRRGRTPLRSWDSFRRSLSVITATTGPSSSCISRCACDPPSLLFSIPATVQRAHQGPVINPRTQCERCFISA